MSRRIFKVQHAPRLPQVDFALVLRRPIETTAITEHLCQYVLSRPVLSLPRSGFDSFSLGSANAMQLCDELRRGASDSLD
jgi:hypothetical protein